MIGQPFPRCIVLLTGRLSFGQTQTRQVSYVSRFLAEVFLAVEENNNGKDSRKKTTKQKWQDKKPLLAG